MKTLFKVVIGLLISQGALAVGQVNCYQYGNITQCSNGVNAYQYGNITQIQVPNQSITTPQVPQALPTLPTLPSYNPPAVLPMPQYNRY